MQLLVLIMVTQRLRNVCILWRRYIWARLLFGLIGNINLLFWLISWGLLILVLLWVIFFEIVGCILFPIIFCIFSIILLSFRLIIWENLALIILLNSSKITLLRLRVYTFRWRINLSWQYILRWILVSWNFIINFSCSINILLNITCWFSISIFSRLLYIL